MKLKEDWYRNNLYHPFFANHAINSPHYDLIQLNENIFSSFPLISRLHYLYAKHVLYLNAENKPYTERDDANLQDLLAKPKIELPHRNSQRAKKGFLIHTYNRPYVNLGNIQETDLIKETNQLFEERDKTYDHSLIRENTQIGRRIRDGDIPTNYSVYYRDDHGEYNNNIDTLITPSYRKTYKKMLSSFDNFELVKLLKEHNLFDHVCLAGGSVTNTIIDFNVLTDYDLFLYGVNEEEANQLVVKLIEVIEPRKVLRSENALTLLKYRRKTQIILRLYKSISEILHGFDVDCCCTAYDGKNIWMTPRAHLAITEMMNFVDFDRMSPTYEYRLGKYMARGFSVYIPEYDEDKTDFGAVHSFIHSQYQPNAPIEKRWSYKNLSSLKGIDLIIYQSFKRLYSSFSDYAPAINGKRLTPYYFREDDADKWLIKTKQGDTLVIQSPNYGDSLSDELINLVMDASSLFTPNIKTTLSPKIKWKTINPGEQATGTFHRIVLTDVSQWYRGQFYRYS